LFPTWIWLPSLLLSHMMVSKAHGLRVYGDGDLFIYCIFPWYPAGITAKRMKAPSPRYLTSQLWMNFILIELNMTCKGSTQFTPEFFCFDVHIFCCAIIYLFSWKIIPFWVLMFASISPCANNTCYIYAYIFYLIFFFDIHELIYVSSFHILSFDLTIFLRIPNIVVGLCCMMWSWIPQIPPPSHSKIVSTKMLCLDNGMKK
jgi:hypothetical protein